MKYLLDTCVISELIKRMPNRNVVRWCEQVDDEELFLSVLTFGEIHKGIEKLSETRRKNELHQWVENDLKKRFEKRILSIDLNVAKIWGKIQGKAEKSGEPMPTIDGLIAATGKTYNLTVVTRNIDDMKPSGVLLYNPWK